MSLDSSTIEEGTDLEHVTESSHEGETDDSYDYDDDSTYDPRRSLATTATMQTYVTETATMDSEDSEESQPLRRQVALVSPLARLLLPRSGRVAFAVSSAGLLVIGTLAAVAALVTVERFYSDVGDALAVTGNQFSVAQADTTVQGASALHAVAVLAGGDAELSATASSLGTDAIAATRTLRLAFGSGDTTTSDDAARSALWWDRARDDTRGLVADAPTVSPDLTACASDAVSSASSALTAAQAADQAGEAALFLPPENDAVVSALAHAAALLPRIDVVTDANLAAAATTVAGSQSTTKTALIAAFERAVVDVSALASLLFAPPVATGAAEQPFVVSRVTEKQVALLQSSNAWLAPVAFNSVRRSVVAASLANTSLAVIDPFLASLGQWNVSQVEANVRDAAATFHAARAALVAVRDALAPSGDPAVDGSSSVPTTALVTWFAATGTREAAFAFNNTALARLLDSGLTTTATLQTPWLNALRAADQATVDTWFAEPELQAGFRALGNTACTGALGSVAEETNTLSTYLGAVAEQFRLRLFSDAEGDGGIASEHRGGLIAAVVVLIISIAVMMLYGQWGIATRVSSSTLPYSSFTAGWWLAAVFVAAATAWSLGYALAELDDDTTRRSPRELSTRAADVFTAQRDGSAVFRALSLVADSTRGDAALDETVNATSTAPVLTRDATLAWLSGNISSSAAEDELVGLALLRHELFATQPEYQPAATATVDRFSAACSAASAARRVTMGTALSMEARLHRVARVVTASAATSAASTRAAALSTDVQLLTDTAITSTSSLATSCSGSTSTFAAFVGRTNEATTRSRSRIAALAAADAQRDAAGDLVPTSARLEQLLPLRSTVLQRAETLSSTATSLTTTARRGAWENDRDIRMRFDARARPLRRHIVWGSAVGCILAEALLALLWRLLFGPSWTPY